MPLPLSWRGKLVIPTSMTTPITADEIMGGISRALERARASNVTTTGGQITYRVAWFRPGTTNWNILSTFDRGVVSVRTGPAGLQVDYEVSFRRLFFGTVIMVPGFFATMMIGIWRESLADALPVLAFMWLWLYGANVLIALARYPEFLRRAVTAEIEVATTRQSHQTPAQSA